MPYSQVSLVNKPSLGHSVGKNEADLMPKFEVLGNFAKNSDFVVPPKLFTNVPFLSPHRFFHQAIHAFDGFAGVIE